MRVIAFYNLKGGVGKTAAAVNIAYLAAQSGIPTLLWDLDPQASASWYLQSNQEVPLKPNKLLKGKIAIGEVVQHSPYPNLDIIPADLSLRNLDIQIAKQDSNAVLGHLLSALSEDYGLIVLDCAPSISKTSFNVFESADALYVPVIPTHLSYQTFLKIEQVFAEHKLKAKKLKPFFSLVDRRRKMHQEFIEQTPKALKARLQGYIPYASAVEKMGEFRQPLPLFAGRTPSALAYNLLWEEIRKDLKI